MTPHAAALAKLLTVLDQAAPEPDDAIAVTTHFDAMVQRQGLTWGDLRALAAPSAPQIECGACTGKVAPATQRALVTIGQITGQLWVCDDCAEQYEDDPIHAALQRLYVEARALNGRLGEATPKSFRDALTAARDALDGAS